ncbi:hypothetical protein, partial [Bacteroides fragilis]|uniref:hypothetical protein n=1 Tax=Bacteroides fragilis TaxID=817 RepID=UPI0005167E1E
RKIIFLYFIFVRLKKNKKAKKQINKDNSPPLEALIKSIYAINIKASQPYSKHLIFTAVKIYANKKGKTQHRKVT